MNVCGCMYMHTHTYIQPQTFMQVHKGMPHMQHKRGAEAVPLFY